MVTNDISIDSFKLRIPIDKIKIIDSVLQKTVLSVLAETGEQYKEPEICNKRYFEYGSLKLEISIEKISDTKNIISTFLTLKLTSKHLKERYLEGVTKNNINILYQTIMSFNAVLFDLETMLNSKLSDCDFKRDANDTLNSFPDIIKQIMAQAKESKLVGRGYKLFNKANNKGIQFSDRPTASTSNPYVKFYHKGLELMSRSNEFYNEYLADTDVTNIIRQEVTIKNRQHFLYYKITDITLRAVLDIDQHQLKAIFENMLSKQLNKRFEKLDIQDNISIDIVLESAIAWALKLGLTPKMIIEAITGTMTRTRRFKYTNLINQILGNKDFKISVEKNENMGEILSIFGIA